MAVIEWQPSAWQLFNDYLENARIAFGQKTGRKWENEIAVLYEQLKVYPTSYTPERLLQGRSKMYRSCHMMSRRFKLIYYYDEESDVVYIVDIWDTLVNPKALIKRIR